MSDCLQKHHLALARLVGRKPTRSKSRNRRGGRAVPKNYTFSFALSAKPQIPVSGYTNVRISGGGSGSFSIAHRQIDRDGTVSWDVVKPRASFWLSAGGKVFVRGTIVGGHYGVEKATGGYSRNVSFTVRITSTTAKNSPSARVSALNPITAPSAAKRNGLGLSAARYASSSAPVTSST